MESILASGVTGPTKGVTEPSAANGDEASGAAFSAAMDDAEACAADADLGNPPAGDPPPPGKPSATDTRPAGDNRSAQEIINGDPTLKNLGNQSGVKDNLKKQVGDFDKDPDAAYRASQVLAHIKGSKTSDGEDRSSGVKDNGKIEGFTKDGDARHGTEAGLLQDFGKNGYSALKDDQVLDKTNDGHVKKDGTNMDNAAFAGHKIAEGLSDAAGWIGDKLDNLPGPLKALFAPVHMISKTASGALNVADTAIKGGDVKQAGKDMAHDVLSTGADIIKAGGELAGDTLGKVPGIGKLISAGAEVTTTAISGGLNVADTAIQGGDVKEAGKKMGFDVAQSAVESAVGLVDPTGIAADAAGEAFRSGVDKKGGGSADGRDNEGVSRNKGKGGKGKGGALADTGRSKGEMSAGAGSARGGVSADEGRVDKTSPKRSADQAGLADRTDGKAKEPRTDNPSDGTYGKRDKDAAHVGATPGTKPGTYQSEHIVPAKVGLQPGDKRGKGDGGQRENSMPAYYEDFQNHRDHAGTGRSSISSEDRRDRTGWPSSERYRQDMTTTLNDPAAQKTGTNLSNAYQLNQLGYAQQAGYAQRQNPGQARPSPDPVVTDSFGNMVQKNPPLTHPAPGGGTFTDRSDAKDPAVRDKPSGTAPPVTQRLDPEGQALTQLSYETRTTGQWPTRERENEVRNKFGI